MQVERWKQIEELYQAALAAPPEKRAAFLAQACPDDLLLRGEVESLLKATPAAGSFLEGSPLSSREHPRPALKPGAKLGHFEIIELIGRGGMGEVYRARDSRLKRDVAIKVLPESFARDPDRIARFQLEARAASALNHPNIVSIYDVGHENDTYWIVSELVGGEPLQRSISRGPMAPRQTIEIAAQIAEGLAAAHEGGIVHRDLKPGNVMVTREGRAKILDFGLAKYRRPATEVSATLTDHLTDAGVVMGTAAYMSPEQVRGGAVDPRSDIFSLGVILHEMLSGKRAFQGDSSVEIMNAILKDDPLELPPSVPAPLDRIARRCLEKDRARRFQSAADLAFALQVPSASPLPSAPPRGAVLRGAATTAAFAAVTGVVLFWLLRPMALLQVRGMTQITHDALSKQVLPFLSDGSRLFFRSNGTIRQVAVKGGEAVTFTTQLKGEVYLLDITPDHTEFLVCRYVAPRFELWAEPVLGGSPRRLGNLEAHHVSAAWSPDGRQLAYPHYGELRVALRDGMGDRKLASVPGLPFSPRWSPDGRRIRFSLNRTNINGYQLWEVASDGTGLHQLLPGWNPSWSACFGAWTPDGSHFVFQANDSLWSLRETRGILARAGLEPIKLNTGLLRGAFPLPSADGKRLLFEGYQARNEFVRYNLRTDQFSFELPGVSGTELEFSRDGKWVTYVSVPEQSLFRSAVDGTQRLQLTSPPMRAGMPHWSPDGTQIAFSGDPLGVASPEERLRIYVVSFEGGALRQVTKGETGKYGEWDPSWSPDGTALAYGSPGSVAGIEVVGLKTDRVAALPGSENMWSPRWSPDNRFVAGLLADNRLMLCDLRTRKQVALANRSGYPSWSPNGQFLFFVAGGHIWRARISDGKLERINGASPLGGGWFAIAPNDSLITSRNIGTDEIYALDLEGK